MSRHSGMSGEARKKISRMRKSKTVRKRGGVVTSAMVARRSKLKQPVVARDAVPGTRVVARSMYGRQGVTGGVEGMLKVTKKVAKEEKLPRAVLRARKQGRNKKQ